MRSTATGNPAGTVERLYFTGYTVFTLGNGDFRPGAGTWQLATVAATGTGLVLITLAITYAVGKGKIAGVACAASLPWRRRTRGDGQIGTRRRPRRPRAVGPWLRSVPVAVR